MKPTLPKILSPIEGPAVLVVACTVYGDRNYSQGWFAATMLLPDVFLPGYLAGPRTGAGLYNLAHTYLTPLLLAAELLALDQPSWLCGPLVWMAHIGMNRGLGFGLKYPAEFKTSHLARV